MQLQLYIIARRIGRASHLDQVNAFKKRMPKQKHGSQGLGSRLTVKRNYATTKQPLNEALAATKKWFDNERLFQHEVRNKHIIQEFKYQCEYLRDKHIVLRDTGSKDFDQRVLDELICKLSWIEVSCLTKKQSDFFTRTVKPYIGAYARTGQNKQQVSGMLDRNKFMATAQALDFIVWLVCEGSREDLEVHVQDPDDFIAKRRDTVFIVLDETAMWLKLRGEEQVMLSISEVLDAGYDRIDTG